MKMPKETNVKTNGKTDSSQATQLGVDELNPLDAAVAYLKEYAKERPEVVALWVFGIGFVLGWKLKPW
jgi:hypothetical protein